MYWKSYESLKIAGYKKYYLKAGKNFGKNRLGDDRELAFSKNFRISTG
jgi:hypothetical protein